MKRIISLLIVLSLLCVTTGCSDRDSKNTPNVCPPAIKLDGIYYYGHLEDQVKELPEDAKGVATLQSICEISRMPEDNGVNFQKFEIGETIYKSNEKYYLYNADMRKYWVFVDWPIEAQMSGEKDEHRNDNYDISQFKKAKTGDIIKFGSYEQDNNTENGKEPIEWIVLSNDEKKLFLLSKYVLDCLPYNDEWEDVTWETCTLRKWLNDKFYAAAFNKIEQGVIKTMTLENIDNPEYKSPGGNDTKDKVFLLSLFDIRNSDYGFSKYYDTEDENRRCGATAYAKDAGVSTFGFYKTKDGEDTCIWWFRSPGENTRYAALIGENGYVSPNGYCVHCDCYGVRPAIVLNLNLAMWNAYADIADAYYSAQKEFKNTGILPENGLNSLYFAPDGTRMEQISKEDFLVYDVNDDGTPEFFISRYYDDEKKDVIYDAYTWNGVMAVRFLKDDEIGYRSGTCDIRENGIILSFYSGSAWDSGFEVLTLPEHTNSVMRLEKVYAVRAGNRGNYYSEYYRMIEGRDSPEQITEEDYHKYCDSFEMPELNYSENVPEMVERLRGGNIEYEE